MAIFKEKKKERKKESKIKKEIKKIRKEKELLRSSLPAAEKTREISSKNSILIAKFWNSRLDAEFSATCQ